MATASPVQTLEASSPNIVDCSHWLESTATARGEARNLVSMNWQEWKHSGIDSRADCRGPRIEEALRLYLRSHREDTPGIETVLRFRKRVRQEFDRLIRRNEPSRTPWVVPLPSDGVIDHVEPAQNAVEDHPEDGMVEAP
jgi:hypothetical protein